MIKTHTKGPWKLSTVIGGNIYVDDNTKISNSICEVFYKNKANAQLIAAAPEMLAALENMLSEFSRLNGRPCIISDDLIKELTAAVNKAKGEV